MKREEKEELVRKVWYVTEDQAKKVEILKEKLNTTESKIVRSILDSKLSLKK